jgi:hypothetical protein
MGAHCSRTRATCDSTRPSPALNLTLCSQVRGGAASGNRTPDLLITRGLIPAGTTRYVRHSVYASDPGALQPAQSATVGEHVGELVVHCGRTNDLPILLIWPVSTFYPVSSRADTARPRRRSLRPALAPADAPRARRAAGA